MDFMKFLFPEIALWPFKFTIQPCMTGVNTEIFFGGGGGSTKKCDEDCNQALIKSS